MLNLELKISFIKKMLHLLYNLKKKKLLKRIQYVLMQSYHQCGAFIKYGLLK